MAGTAEEMPQRRKEPGTVTGENGTAGGDRDEVVGSRKGSWEEP